ncbi:neuronal acetylcholine receptor subunit alpha-9-II-like [Hippocampus comes]|uniref:neuronal acetylcholine receptor subunit alpha-9-II-like n=1 Tax=Hippocampus comes TaxID=109280 RepID=UPI00094EE422|nr:PREDICTED: neuronal acetylcholine receptor subunit alpha-9-II-like [Hippocampus comes]
MVVDLRLTAFSCMKRSEMQSLLCLFVCVSMLTVSRCAHSRFARKLLNDLFDNYTSALRPVEDTEAVLNVTLQVTLSQIIDMDERNQILTAYLWIRRAWRDAHLKWSKEDYDGLDTIRIPSSYVWRPDIVLYNNADDHFTGPMDTNVVIRHDGRITWDSPAITKSSCKVDVSFFPFDAQQCRFTYGSWTYNGNQLDILNAMESADLADLVDNVEWQVLGMAAKRNIVLYGCCADPYPDVTFTLKLKRRASFYVFNLLIPCVMISFLAPLGFYLPADSGEKVSLGVTVMLALTVFQLLVAEIMPPSENVPLIGRGESSIRHRYYREEKEDLDGSLGVKHTDCYSPRQNAAVVSMDDDDDLGRARRCRKGGVSERRASRGPPCDERRLLLPNVEYIANCYREQRATQKRTGEWKKVAKVLDRFFMWSFFIMVFFMSLLIMGKAV